MHVAKDRENDNAFNPFTGIEDFFAAPYAKRLAPPFESATTYSYSAAFFGHTAEGIRRLRRYANGLTVELFAGDGYEVMDGIRFGTIPRRPEGYPSLFDRCHLSNVPDYAYVVSCLSVLGSVILTSAQLQGRRTHHLHARQCAAQTSSQSARCIQLSAEHR